MEILVEPDRRIWESVARRTAFWPLQQDWDYGLAARWQGREVLRLAARDGSDVCGALQLVGRRWFGLAQVWLALRGPVTAPVSDAAEAALLAAIPTGLLRANLIAPERAADAALDRRWQARARIYTGASCALLDLQGKSLAGLRAGLHQKWRNRLVAAERGTLRVETATRGKWIDWAVEHYDRVRAAKNFAGPSRDFVARLAELKAPRETLAVVALDRREPVAGALFLRHGPDASYYVAATTPEGKAKHAANLVLWQGIASLKESGVRRLDLGTVDTDRSPGLARFKLGTGAAPLTLAGTYL